MKNLLLLVSTGLGLGLSCLAGAADDWTMPRTHDGKPDLQGIWSNATQTPPGTPG